MMTPAQPTAATLESTNITTSTSIEAGKTAERQEGEIEITLNWCKQKYCVVVEWQYHTSNLALSSISCFALHCLTDIIRC